jgi:hypothetical protein
MLIGQRSHICNKKKPSRSHLDGENTCINPWTLKGEGGTLDLCNKKKKKKGYFGFKNSQVVDSISRKEKSQLEILSILSLEGEPHRKRVRAD